MRAGRLAQGGMVLAWALTKLGLWVRPELLLLTAFCIVGGACLFYGLFVLTATASFWTVESLELANTVTYGGTETAQYPLSIYPRWFRAIFTFLVPLACVTFFPAQVLLSRAASGWGAVPLWLAPAVGILFLAVSLRVWELGVRRYHSTGS
jgi:ABC-2 type transport system permease protein